MLAILLNDLLPPISQLKNSTFEEALVFTSEEQVLLIVNSLIGVRNFTIQIVLKGQKRRNLILLSQGHRVDVGSVPNGALLIFDRQVFDRQFLTGCQRGNGSSVIMKDDTHDAHHKLHIISSMHAQNAKKH